jgi:hypothetical protein
MTKIFLKITYNALLLKAKKHLGEGQHTAKKQFKMQERWPNTASCPA